MGPQASLSWSVLSPRLLCVHFDKLSELYKPVSQEKINKEFGKKKMWRHIRDAPKACPPRESRS